MRLHPEKTFEAAKTKVVSALADLFPIVAGGRSLSVDQVVVDDNVDMNDLRGQKAARLAGRSWTVPVKAKVVLRQQDGQGKDKVVDSRTMVIARLPKITPRFSYLHKGSEYQVNNQLLLRPGVYNRRRADGTLASEIHVKGRPFMVKFDPESKRLRLSVGTSNPDLLPVLSALGVTDQQMSASWGDDVWRVNKQAADSRRGRTAVRSFVQSLTGRRPEGDGEAAHMLVNRMAATAVDPAVVGVTLGRPYERLSGPLLADAGKALVDINAGRRAVDNRDSLTFKRFRAVEDQMADRLAKAATTIGRKAGNKMGKVDDVRQILPRQAIQRALSGMFVDGNGLVDRGEQTNPVEFLAGHTKVTVLGEGGLSSERSATSAMKFIDPSHMGFIDPLHTPEGGRTGLVLHLSEGVEKVGDTLATPMLDVRTGKMVMPTVGELRGKTIVVADQLDVSRGRPLDKKKQVRVFDIVDGVHGQSMAAGKADLIMLAPQQLFSPTTNLIPFVQNNSPVRATTAGRQMEQALPLVNAEVPAVQVGVLGQSNEKRWGKFFAHTSPTAGTVAKVDDQRIDVVDDQGKKSTVWRYHNFPLNGDKAFISSTARVKAGDTVDKGGLLADTTYTKDGVLALGTNLNVGYLNYKGLTFEDGVVISQTGAKKLTSVHLQPATADIREGDRMGKAAFASYFPTVLTGENGKKLDDRGVVKVGQTVVAGDVLIARLAKARTTPESQALGRLHKSLVRPYTDGSQVWDKDYPGRVTDVIHGPTGVTVYVRSTKPAEVGDKLVGRSGNKGVITTILPDSEMPTVAGKPLEMLMAPGGVPGRINLGQMLETAASSIAKVRGRPYVASSFDRTSDMVAKIKGELTDLGLADTKMVVDARTGKGLGKILTGGQYIFKLKHEVEKKRSARAGGPGWSYDRDRIPKGGAPRGGKALGNLGFYALLSAGVKANLREAQTWKTDAGQSDEVWRAIQAGMPLPSPRPTFAHRRFMAYLQALGVQTKKDGHVLTLTPMGDRQTLAMSGGEIADPGKTVRALTPDRPEKGGLFDPVATGGMNGTQFSHFRLPEPMVNPMFARAVKSVLSLGGDDFDDLVSGAKGLAGDGQIVNADKASIVGGRALASMLAGVDVGKELAKAKAVLPTLSKSTLDRGYRRYRYLKALSTHKLKADEAWTMSVVPVLPPAFRPLAVMADGSIARDDLNDMYRGVGLMANKLTALGKIAPPSEVVGLRRDLYDGLAALTGIGSTPQLPYRGIIDIVEGKRPEGGHKRGQPKEGFFQRKLLGAKQDLTMSSTITPDPRLALDEVGLPRKAAMTMFKPFVIAEISQIAGVTPLAASKMYKEGTPTADRALERVAERRPVMLKRDPALHKYSVQAFKPKLIDGKQIAVHPLVTSGFNADFDGDSHINSLYLFVSDRAMTSMLSSSAPWGCASWWDDRKLSKNMAARFGEGAFIVGDIDDVGSGWSGLVNLEDFPHLEKHRTVGHIDYHPVADDLFVLAYDEQEKKFVTAQVAGWSAHRDVRVEVIALRSGRDILADDDPRAVYGVDPTTMTVGRWRPAEAVGKLVPTIGEIIDDQGDEFDDDGRRGRARTISFGEGDGGDANTLKSAVNMDEQLGRFYGYLVADGWVSIHKGKITGAICFAKASPTMREVFTRTVNNLFVRPPEYTLIAGTHEAFGQSCFHAKLTFSSIPLASALIHHIGHLSTGKHLPPFFLTACRQFRLGLLAGLLDTDGSMSISKGKTKPQFMCSYTTASTRLAKEVALLSRSLGVRAKITPTTTPAGSPFWVITLSTPGMWLLQTLTVEKESHRQAWDWFCQQPDPGGTPAAVRQDVIPIHPQSAIALATVCRRGGNNSAYASCRRAATTGYVTRKTAALALSMAGGDPHFDQVQAYVDRREILWDVVVAHHPTDIVTTGYDLTVPGYETFMSADGVILSNTMTAFTPISAQAVAEAKTMMPSHNLFSPASGEIMYTPTQEMQTGLFLMSRPGRRTRARFANLADAEKAVTAGKVGVTDQLFVGKSGLRTTVGRQRIAAALPAVVGKAYLKADVAFDKQVQRRFLHRVGKEFAPAYGQVAGKLKDLGDAHMYSTAFSLGLDDLKTEVGIRDKILSAADKLADKAGDRQKIKIYDRATTAMLSAVDKKKAARPDNLWLLQKSGVKPGPDQYRQLVLAPMLVRNPDGSIIPTPIRRSFAEGLDLADYWRSSSGARRGIIEKVQSVREPGMVTKQMMNSAMDEVVVDRDCHTGDGINLPVDADAQIVDRLLAKSVKAGSRVIPAGTVIDQQVVDQLRANKVNQVVVRSPLRCAHGQGLCASCYGLDENGRLPEVGRNLGVQAAHALGERSTQLALKAFHGGGVVTAGTADPASAHALGRFDRVQQLLNSPTHLPGAAPLAEVGGRVNRVDADPGGGWRVDIAGVDHYVPPGLGKPTVDVGGKATGLKSGMSVGKGDRLSAGPVNPHQLLALTDIGKVQRYLSDELFDVYKRQGIDRRAVETVVRSITNTAKVDDAGDVGGYVRGDTIAVTAAAADNRRLKPGQKPMSVVPFFRGVNIMPLAKTEDWMARLNHTHLKNTLVEAAQQGWSSRTEGLHPIPAAITGVTFGRGKFY